MSIENLFESMKSGDDEGGGNEKMTDGGLTMSEGSDDLGDLEDLASDEMDGFGDMDDAAGAGTDELAHRFDELENEVGSLSSTVSTVRTENEQISESVDEVEENVQKLLDIYEMVTRGVNPFTDDIEAGMGGDSSFGLFDEEDGSQQEEEIDDDIVNADAEGFFDEELTEDTGEEEPASDGNAGDADDIFTNESSDTGSEDDGGIFDDGNLDDEEQDSGDGTTFQDLKNEYESGDAEWTAGQDPKDGTAAGDVTVGESDGSEDNLGADELFTDGIAEDRGRATVTVDTEPKSEPESDSATEDTSGSTSTSQSTAGARKPYLDTLPSGYTDDLIVLEWIGYLIQQAGYRETTRAIEYYETIDWIAGDVADDLQKRLRGFDGVDEGDRGLTIDHHTQSLQYISQLDDDGGAEAVMLSKLAGRGGQNGLQR